MPSVNASPNDGQPSALAPWYQIRNATTGKIYLQLPRGTSAKQADLVAAGFRLAFCDRIEVVEKGKTAPPTLPTDRIIAGIDKLYRTVEHVTGRAPKAITVEMDEGMHAAVRPPVDGWPSWACGVAHLHQDPPTPPRFEPEPGDACYLLQKDLKTWFVRPVTWEDSSWLWHAYDEGRIYTERQPAVDERNRRAAESTEGE